jgi:hypothetical protein
MLGLKRHLEVAILNLYGILTIVNSLELIVALNDSACAINSGNI